MLHNLHVKNLALIDEIEVEFQSGLNILTGETGAGKSIILGSIHLALGGKYSVDMLRKGADFGLVELTFSVENENIDKILRQLDIFPEEGMIVLSRKLMDGRSVSKINGETVNMSLLKNVASILIDIHGQHEHQSLLHKKNHLAILDAYARDTVLELKQETEKAYRLYQTCRTKLEQSRLDEMERKRELALLEFETEEIAKAELKDREDELLEEEYRRMTGGKKITESVGEAYTYTSEGEGINASDALSRAIRALQETAQYDEQGKCLLEQLVEVDSLLNDFNRELSEYAKSFEFSETDFYEVETRLNTLNHLKAKYGNSVVEIQQYYEEKCQRLNQLTDYETYISAMEEECQTAEKQLKECADRLSLERQKQAVSFVKEIKKHLQDLNFLDVQFDMQFTLLDHYTEHGIDDGEFFISTNPGELLKPLKQIASGGELSRIMLAMKTVLADKEDTPTLIFDEIDAGISGITAGKVADKMNIIGKNHQIICITHLPQIAAMADAHYVIEKTASGNKTKTGIALLTEKKSVEELARILGGASITDTIMKSAKEMKELAKSEK